MDFLLKKSRAIDLYNPLCTFVSLKYHGNELANILSSIQYMNTLRMKLLSMNSLSEGVIETYQLYYEYLEQLYCVISEGEIINRLEFNWTDVFSMNPTKSNDINVERASILMNLALIYHINASSLVMGNVSFEAMVQAIEKEKKSISIITYIQNSISPLLPDEEITWDCTKEGLQAIGSFFNATYHYYYSFQKALVNDHQLSFCYCRRSYELYSQCISCLKTIPQNFETSITKIRFLQLFYLYNTYYQYILISLENVELQDDQTTILPALVSILTKSVSDLKLFPLYTEITWKKHVDLLIQNIHDIIISAKAIGITEDPNPEETLKNIPICNAEDPAPFSFLHTLNPVFDVLIPSQTLVKIHSLQKEYLQFCKQTVFEYQKKLQDFNNKYSSLNVQSTIQSVSDTRSVLLNSLSKVDFLQSSGQLSMMEENYNKVNTMRTSCLNLIKQLECDTETELQEELQSKQDHPELEIHQDYLQSIQAWLENTKKVLNSKNETLAIYTQQVTIFKQQFSSIQSKRMQLDRMSPLVLSASQQSILQHMKEKKEQIEYSINSTSSCITKIDKLCADDMVIRLAVVNEEKLHMNNSARQLAYEKVKSKANDVSMKLSELENFYSSLKNDCELFEGEIKQNPAGNEQRDLLERINQVDELYRNCIGFVTHALTEFENIVNSLSQLFNSFSHYRKQMQDKRAAYRIPPPSPSSEHMIELSSRSSSQSSMGKGWTCSICGIVNDIKSITCDGCLQRRI